MTITEIANMAGVSIGTVDRVIHNRGKVSQKTAEKVTAIINEFGYVPNPLARRLKLNRAFVIGVLLPRINSEDGYWEHIYRGIKKAEKELKHFSITIQFLEFDREQTNSCLKAGKKLLETSIDALILSPVIPEETYALLANHQDCNYAFVDSPLPNLHPVAIIAQNPYQGGYLAGRLMHMLAPQANMYMSFQMFSIAYNSKERSRGFISYFQKDASKTIIELPYISKNTEKDIELFLDDFFAIYPKIGGIFVVNDAVHRMADYLVKRKLKEKIVLIGYDLIAQNLLGLKNGSIDCLLSQRPEQQGYLAVYELYRKLILCQQTQEIHIPIDIYFKENLCAV